MRNVFSTKVLMAAGLLAFALTANAGTKIMRATIPFPFLAGNDTLPAGDYMLTFDEFHTVTLQSVTEARMTRTPLTSNYATRKVEKPSQGVVQFKKYGDTYVLNRVWAPGIEEGYAVRPSARARELVRIHGTDDAATVAIQ
jgi:hypothetical protein